MILVQIYICVCVRLTLYLTWRNMIINNLNEGEILIYEWRRGIWSSSDQSRMEKGLNPDDYPDRMCTNKFLDLYIIELYYIYIHTCIYIPPKHDKKYYDSINYF